MIISLDCPFHDKPCYWNQNECTALRDTRWLVTKGYEDCPFRKTANEVQELKKKYPYKPSRKTSFN